MEIYFKVNVARLKILLGIFVVKGLYWFFEWVYNDKLCNFNIRIVRWNLKIKR
ncbi:hypothetical protein [Helicobacter colisuis]|uniref:Uncharacterized protein n=1 Tax=Helicobacter colisuis TaxID=2949739 RepID=A0ABT0TTQ4_9HELI|nr:hypothetical protein [Helicobacter colisuis]MCL9819304.1 hypothetical protein [Helicobacter colisuis]